MFGGVGTFKSDNPCFGMSSQSPPRSVKYMVVPEVEAVIAKSEEDTEVAQIEDVSLPSMASMMTCHEGKLRRPIRNLVNGSHSHIALTAQGQTAAAEPQHSPNILATMQEVAVAAAKPDSGLEAAQIKEISLPGMASMMGCFGGELKRLIRNLVNGCHSHTPLLAQA